MPAEARHHVSGSLPLAVALAGSAGFVDAFVFVNVAPVFVANMSGNLVRLGMDVGDGAVRPALAALVALLSFLTGAFVATSQVDRRLRSGAPASSRHLFVVEALLLAAVAAALHFGRVGYAAEAGNRQLVIIAVAALAMGLQAVALRRVGQVAVSTTYGTGAVVRLGEKLALGVRRAARPSDLRRRVTVIVLVAVLVGYVCGAAIAAAVGGSPALLLVPAGVMLVASRVVDGQHHASAAPPSAPGASRSPTS